MFLQGRVIIVWLSWLVGGICGVVILLIIICYCRLMPRHQKSFDEQYLKENYTIKEGHGYTNQDNFRVSKHNEVSVQVQRHARPASYAGDGECRRGRSAHSTHNTHAAHNTHTAHTHTSHSYVNRVPDSPRDHPAHASYTHHAVATAVQYASSGMLDEVEAAGGGGGGGAGSSASMDALKTRSLPAFLRPKPRPLSTEDDLHQLYAKVNLSKKYKKRMRSEHAAIIALSKSHSQFFDADAVIVYDQRTEL